jgi:hypothetical protein
MKKQNNITPQIVAILNEIERLNNIISLHKDNEYGEVMIEQYQRLKMQYIADLEQIMLDNYQISFLKIAA